MADPTPEPMTPYAEALALLRSGAAEPAILERLRARGLDAAEISLLLQAARARAADREQPPAASEWVQSSPTAQAAAEEPQSVPDAPLPSEAPLGTCSRCGAFVTPATSQSIFTKVHCLACAARPEVNLPRAYRDAHWGRRDSWAWFFGVWAVIALFVGGAMALTGEVLISLPALGAGLVYALFWLGWKPSRLLIIGVSIAAAAVELAARHSLFVLHGASGIALTIRAVASTRNKLFFEIEPTEDELIAAWSAAHDNHVALWARGLGVVALLSCLAWLGVPKVAFGTLVLGGVAAGLGGAGLSRVNPNAMPPIGQRGAALFGIISGALGLVAAGVFMWVKGLVP